MFFMRSKRVLNNLLNVFAVFFILCATNAVSAHEKDINTEQIAQLLDSALSLQKVYVTAPGLPSKLHEFALVAEDPDAKENQTKKYHPAEKAGWKHMIEYGVALQKAGALNIKHGTFFEDDFYNRRFKFTGVLMEFKTEMKDYVAVTPKDGRVLLRVGTSGLDRIISCTRQGDHMLEVSFVTALKQRSPWFTDEVASFTKISSLLGGNEKVMLKEHDGRYEIADDEFQQSLSQPVTDFR